MRDTDGIIGIHLTGVNDAAAGELVLARNRKGQCVVDCELLDVLGIPGKIEAEVGRIGKLAIFFLAVIHQLGDRKLLRSEEDVLGNGRINNELHTAGGLV